MTEPGTIKILHPKQEAMVKDAGIAPRLDVTGKVILYRHLLSWTNFDPFLRRIQELMEQRFRTAGSVRLNQESSTHLTPQSADEFAGKVDAAILGLGN